MYLSPAATWEVENHDGKQASKLADWEDFDGWLIYKWKGDGFWYNSSGVHPALASTSEKKAWRAVKA